MHGVMGSSTLDRWSRGASSKLANLVLFFSVRTCEDRLSVAKLRRWVYFKNNLKKKS